MKQHHDAERRLASALAAPVLHGEDALALAAMGTAQARDVLLAFAPDEVAGALQELSAKEQVAFLEVAERLPEIVPHLPETTLTHAIRGVGLADAGWLVEFASPEQRVAALDLDCWKNGRISPARLFDWIDALIEAGTETLLASFDDIDAEIWILALQSMAEFSIPSRDPDELNGGAGGEESQELPDGLSQDGVVFYEPRDWGHEERLRSILETARAYAPSLYWDFVYGAITESSRSCEESAKRWHGGRLNDLGFPDQEHAMGVYRPLAVDSAPVVESLSPPCAEQTPVAHVLSGSALGRALAGLPQERAHEIQGQLFALANAIAVADRLPLSEGAAIEHSMRKALEGVDRGLLALATARNLSLSEIADTQLPRDLFRIGVTLSPELRAPQFSLAELEDRQSDDDEVDWGVPTEWLSEADQTVDAKGRLR